MLQEEHKAKVERLLSMDRAEVQRIRLSDLVDVVKRGELTAADIATYTTITPEQLAEMMRT